MTPADRYMDLMKRAVLGILAFDDTAFTVLKDRDDPKPMSSEELKREVYQGNGILPGAETLLGWLRLTQLEEAAEAIETEKIHGDVLVCGLWKGGSTAVLRGALNSYGTMRFRFVYACDSFEGLPPQSHPWDKQMAIDDGSRLAVPEKYVDCMLRRYNLREGVNLVKGWFKDTLPTLKTKWSIIHCDCDFYESTMDVLTNCYDNLSPGGFLIVDDYGTWAACREAVHDFRKERNITEKMIEVDTSAIYWRKK